ncbi:MAG: hypothetical protein LBB40_03315, partial [Holophagales bacterium]|nr:hypothetical protein [Holophagales bacterium]
MMSSKFNGKKAGELTLMISELEEKLQKAREEISELESKSHEASQEKAGLEKITKNFELYGNSLLLVQQTLAKLNTSLSSERHELDMLPQETEEGNRESIAKMDD